MSNVMRLTRYIVVALAIPAIGAIVQFWRNDLITTVFATLATLSVFVGILQYDVNQTKRELSDMTDAVRRIAHVTPVHEQDFYSKFIRRVKLATDRVNLSYFHTEDPRDGSAERKQYYVEILRTIKKSNRVKFRRIDRGHPGLKSWIDFVLKQMAGCTYFSYAIWLDDRAAVQALELVAVQTIDENTTFLVAVGRQEARQGHRDIHVESKDFSDSWNAYYNRLWDDSEKCVIVMERGKLRTDGYQKAMQYISRIEKGK